MFGCIIKKNHVNPCEMYQIIPERIRAQCVCSFGRKANVPFGYRVFFILRE